MTNNNTSLQQPTQAKRLFTRISTKVTKATGNPITFIIAVLIIVAWAIAGPIFKKKEDNCVKVVLDPWA